MTTKLLIDRELLPCPFCGGDPEASPEYQHNPGCYFDVMASFKAAAQDLDFSLVPEVLKAWNRRAAPVQGEAVPVEDRGWPDRDYWCKCSLCLHEFTGHKRQVICRVCSEQQDELATPPQPAPVQGEVKPAAFMRYDSPIKGHTEFMPYEPWMDDGLSGGWVPLYTTPPQPAEGYPACDYCGCIPDHHPWHGSGFINGAESPHIHACNDCRHLLPKSPQSAEVGELYPHGHELHKEVFMARDSYCGGESFEDGVRGLIAELKEARAALAKLEGKA